MTYVVRRRRSWLDEDELRGEPARSRTENQQIKSLLLCQLSYGPTAALRAAELRTQNSELKRRNRFLRPKF